MRLLREAKNSAVLVLVQIALTLAVRNNPGCNYSADKAIWNCAPPHITRRDACADFPLFSYADATSSDHITYDFAALGLSPDAPSDDLFNSSIAMSAIPNSPDLAVVIGGAFLVLTAPAGISSETGSGLVQRRMLNLSAYSAGEGFHATSMALSPDAREVRRRAAPPPRHKLAICHTVSRWHAALRRAAASHRPGAGRRRLRARLPGLPDCDGRDARAQGHSDRAN